MVIPKGTFLPPICFFFKPLCLADLASSRFSANLAAIACSAVIGDSSLRGAADKTGDTGAAVSKKDWEPDIAPPFAFRIVKIWRPSGIAVTGVLQRQQWPS